MTTLLVAAGGGGDAIGALLVRRLVAPGGIPLIATCAWERLRVDPTPGPRGVEGFERLGVVGGRPVEILPGTETTPPGLSTLPRLAEETSARLFLVDLSNGAQGVKAQLLHLAQSLGADRIALVDVGGDAVAEGTEVGLRSPVADAIMLAGAYATSLPVTLVVTGPGLDAELTPAQVKDRMRILGARLVGRVERDDADKFEHVLAWHPTEASALLAAAASGTTGQVDMRRGDRPVPIDEESTWVWTLTVTDLGRLPIAAKCQHTRTLDEAEAVAETFGINELRYERQKAGEPPRPSATLDDLARRAGIVGREPHQGVTHITARRLMERIGTAPEQTSLLLARLDAQCPRTGPLWRLADLALLD